jgi:hypothetical protein
MASTPPDQIPRLGRFAHLSPDDGACLMELVSVLAGQPFTDTPAGTHPLLAALARGVNDAVSDHARPALALLAPDLVNLNPSGPDAAIAIVETCLQAALAINPASTALRRHARRTRRHANRLHRYRRHPAVVWTLDRIWRHGPARHALECALRTVVTHPDADDLLHQLLVRCVAGQHPRSPAARSQPHRAAHVSVPPGC